MRVRVSFGLAVRRSQLVKMKRRVRIRVAQRKPVEFRSRLGTAKVFLLVRVISYGEVHLDFHVPML